MSTTKLVTLICWIVVAVVVIGLAVWFLTGNLFGFRTGFKVNMPSFNIVSFENLTGPFNPAGSYETSVGNVDSLDIDWVAGSATITPYDGDVIKVTEFAQRDLNDSERFVCGVSGGTLEIKYCAPGVTFNLLTKKLEVQVPKSLADKLHILDVEATSADLKISDFRADTFSVSETSGTSDIANISAATSDVHSVSGTIDIENLTTTGLTLKTVSGEIQLSNVTADSVTAKTTSGGQELAGRFLNVDAGSISGEIRVTSSVDPDTMKVGTTSGGITVTIPGTDSLTVSYSTVSGHFNSDIPVRTSGSADYHFSSVSGSINLRAAA
jgi:hypothetical protein